MVSDGRSKQRVIFVSALLLTGRKEPIAIAVGAITTDAQISPTHRAAYLHYQLALLLPSLPPIQADKKGSE